MHMTVCVGISAEKIAGKNSNEEISEVVESILHPYVEGAEDKSKWKMDWYVIGGRWEGVFGVVKGTESNNIYLTESGRFAYELFDQYDVICNKGQIGPYVAGEMEYIPATGALMKDIDWYAIDKLNYFWMYRYMQIIMNEEERAERLEGKIPGGFIIENDYIYHASDENKTILYKKGETFEEHISRREIEFDKALLPLDAYVDKQGKWHDVNEVSLDREKVNEILEGADDSEDITELFANEFKNELNKFLDEEMQPDDYLIVLDCHTVGFFVSDYDEQGVMDISEMSIEELEEAANAGDSDAMEQLAMAYLNGDDEIDANPEKAYFWFVKCAETGNEQAMFNVGLFTAKGFGVERDFTKAAEWMQKAADEGDEDAEKCAEEYRKLADAVEKAKSGDAQAQADLAAGLMKIGGALEQAGEDRDFEESLMWAEKAVEQKNPDGYWVLALAYHHGRGVSQNMDKAIELYQKGADVGSAACQHNLGCEYMLGTNVEKDAHKAFELIKTAAEQGHGLAMRDLGKCYQFANGTPGNMKTAVEWYEKALEVIDDPELEQKTMLFKMMADEDPEFDEDYPEEESEVSDEQAQDALQNGKGTIKQVVTLPDGTKKEVAVWGGYEMDGYDRTLNVFMKNSDISTFINLMSEDKLDEEGIDDPCEYEEGYQVTVDYLDIPATLIVRRGQGKLSTEMYVRDERKTCSDIVEVGTGEVELEEVGSLSVGKDSLEKKKFLFYAIAAISVRKYLLKEGIVQKLYDMFDESAGVIIKVSNAGKIITKIVKGNERPDLPCNVFLLGEQMCRPYIDEMLGLQSSGKRKPKNPALIAKMKAQEETKKNAAAEEERRKQEEKEREEKAAQDKFKAEMDAWNELSQELQAKREKEKSAGYEEIEARGAEKKANINNRLTKTLDELNAKIKANKESLEAHKKELASIGVLKFVRKQELNKIIQQEEATATELQFEIKQQTQKFNDELMEVNKWIPKAKSDLDKSIVEKYPIPESPEQIRAREEAERKEKERIANFFAGENGKIKKAILEVLSDNRVKTAHEIKRNLEDFRGVSYGKVELLLSELDKEGYVEHAVHKGDTYYKILKK